MNISLNNFCVVCSMQSVDSGRPLNETSQKETALIFHSCQHCSIKLKHINILGILPIIAAFFFKGIQYLLRSPFLPNSVTIFTFTYGLSRIS